MKVNRRKLLSLLGMSPALLALRRGGGTKEKRRGKRTQDFGGQSQRDSAGYTALFHGSSRQLPRREDHLRGRRHEFPWQRDAPEKNAGLVSTEHAHRQDRLPEEGRGICRG